MYNAWSFRHSELELVAVIGVVAVLHIDHCIQLSGVGSAAARAAMAAPLSTFKSTLTSMIHWHTRLQVPLYSSYDLDLADRERSVGKATPIHDR